MRKKRIAGAFLMTSALFALFMFQNFTSDDGPYYECPPEFGDTMDCKTGALKAPPIPFGSNLGISHAAPRYNPFGELDSSILLNGAKDAYSMGFKSFKLWLNSELAGPLFYGYDATAGIPGGYTNPNYMTLLAQTEQFSGVLALPFQSFFLNTDNFPLGFNPILTPMDDATKNYIYKSMHTLALHFLEKYRGSRKVFVLQNHEGDWHMTTHVGANLQNGPSQIALENYRKYFAIRQQAVNDARLAAMAKDVYVYHMCEVVRVIPSWDQGTMGRGFPKASIARDILPSVGCDLIGYSAYESTAYATAYNPTLNWKSALKASLNYLRRQAGPNFAFGSNNVIISEIGIPENASPSSLVQQTAEAVDFAIQEKIPWILLWTLYDNECRPASKTNSPANKCMGYWARKPDGTLGQLFSMLAPKYLAPLSFSPFTLKTNQSLQAGLLNFVFQEDGNLVLYRKNSVLWNSRTGGQNCYANNCFATFQNDGNLVLYNGGRAYWHTRTGGQTGSKLLISTTPPYISLVKDNSIKWTADSIFPLGFVLNQNQSVSLDAHGGTHMTLKSDGNLAIYSGPNVLWSTKLTGKRLGPPKLVFQHDGNLVLSDNVRPYWNSATASNQIRAYAKRLRVNATAPYLTILDDNNKVLWKSR